MKKERQKRSVVWKYTREEMQQLINDSHSLVDLCKKIGINSRNGSVKSLYARILKENLDLSILKENKKKNGSNNSKKITIESFSENSEIARSSIKRFILSNNLIPYRCRDCDNNGYHNEKILSLQLEHINGVNNDNRLENLCFLCPNCHSQTETYAGKCKKIRQSYIFSIKKIEKNLDKKPKYEQPKKFQIDRDELERLIKSDLSMVKIGKMFGVSDNAIRKRCKTLNIDIKNRSQV